MQSVNDDYCQNCGNPKLYTNKPCPNCEINDDKETYCIPEEIKKWNWGAFFFTWIWGLFNKSYWTLLALIPKFGGFWHFVCGFKGNEWAWKNKQWESVEQFNNTQRKWAIGGIVLVIIFMLSTVMAMLIPLFMP